MLTDWFVYWLGNPILVVSPLLAVIGLPWIFRSQRWLRKLSQRMAIVLLTYLILISPPVVALAMRGIVSPVPLDSGTTADAIVVLGRGKETQASRTGVAAQLLRSNRAPKIFVSGIFDAPQIVEQLQQKGIADRSLDGESCSRTTWENAVFTAASLRPEGVEQIILVTDPPHLWRSVLIFEQFGFRVIAHPSPLQADRGSADNALLLLREYWLLAKYPSDLQFELTPQRQRSQTNALQQMTHDQCRIGKG